MPGRLAHRAVDGGRRVRDGVRARPPHEDTADTRIRQVRDPFTRQHFVELRRPKVVAHIAFVTRTLIIRGQHRFIKRLPHCKTYGWITAKYEKISFSQQKSTIQGIFLADTLQKRWVSRSKVVPYVGCARMTLILRRDCHQLLL